MLSTEYSTQWHGTQVDRLRKYNINEMPCFRTYLVEKVGDMKISMSADTG